MSVAGFRKHREPSVCPQPRWLAFGQWKTTRHGNGQHAVLSPKSRTIQLERKMLRFILLVAASTFVLGNFAGAQVNNPFADVLKSPSELKVDEKDDEPTALMKRCFNAAHNEMRIRYNYWLQDVGEIDGFLASIERLHKVRIEMGPANGRSDFCWSRNSLL